MAKVTKRAERLARALCAVDSPLNFSMAFDRAHWSWPECLEKAQEIIATQNLLEYCEGTRPLHGCVEDANVDRGMYDSRYTGPESHDKITAFILGTE